jgi:hypothetical protein
MEEPVTTLFMLMSVDGKISTESVDDHVKENSFEKEYDLAAHATLIIDEPENIIKILPEMVEIYKGLNGKIKYISLYEVFPVRFIKRIELL